VDEGRHEQPDRELARFVPEPLNNPWRKLAIASWTTTMVMSNTRVVKLTIAAATVDNTALAAVGVPTRDCGRAS
jgi:hypothetical protein